jgi:hypothetical protein
MTTSPYVVPVSGPRPPGALGQLADMQAVV